MIIPSKNINFVHIPKAAGSTVGACINRQVIKTQNDIDFSGEYEAFSKSKGYKFPNHSPAKLRVEYMGKEQYEDLFSFAFVRNPFDLVVSLYEYTWQTEKSLFIKKKWKFNQFQQNILNNSFTDWVMNFDTGRPQYQYLFSDSGQLLVPNIGKTETFDKDFGFISRAIGIEYQPSSHRENTTIRGDYRKYYNDETIKRIENSYKQDLELFGYEF